MTDDSTPQASLSERRIAAMQAKLVAALKPTDIRIDDQSHLHAGHAGAKSGKGHFDLRIVSDVFNGKTLIQRHRAVYAALGPLMETDIHALSIVAEAPDDA